MKRILSLLAMTVVVALGLASCSDGGGAGRPAGPGDLGSLRAPRNPRGSGKRTVYYLTHLGDVRKLNPAPAYYQSHGVVPIVLLDGNGQNLFAEGYDWDAAVSEVRSRIAGPVWVALWCDNVAWGGWQGTTLAPWGEEPAWRVILANGRKLAAAGTRYGISGVAWDGEIYSLTPEKNGGRMTQKAWSADPLAATRARTLREAFGTLPQAQYVLVDDADGHAGWNAYWGAYYRSGDLLLDESGFLPGTERKTRFADQGVTNLPGRAIDGGKFRGRVPDGDFWLYPFRAEDKTADLGLFAPLWRAR